MRIFLSGVTCLLAMMPASARAQEHSRSVNINRGQGLAFETIDPLNWNTARVGDLVRLRLKRPLVVEGLVVLPVGARADGQILHIKRTKCGVIDLDWDIQSVYFSDGSRVRTKLEVQAYGADANLPQMYSSEALNHSHREVLRALLLAPFVVPIAILESPGLVAMAFADSDKGPCVPRSNILPQASSIGVAIIQNHRVRY